ncbi:MAG: glycerophosphodiester phosphodiesterase family protein [Neisseriaceae bacterium]
MEIKRNKSIEVYGHRGCRSYAPENSIPAYKTALSVGVNWVDIDIGLTKDGKIVAYHDLWINPDFTSKDGKFLADSNEEFILQMIKKDSKLVQSYLLKNITFEKLQEYDIGILNPNSRYASYFPEQVKIKDTRIPSFQQVIDCVDKISDRNVNYQIEIKNDPLNPIFSFSSKEIVSILYEELKRNNLIERVEVQAFDWELLYQLQSLDNNIRTAYLIAYNEIDMNNPDNFKGCGIWCGGELLKKYNNSMPYMVKSLGGSCYEPEDVILSQRDLDKAHELGLKVAVWSWPEHSGQAFDRKLIDKLITWGVDGITTDDPKALNSMLFERGFAIPRNFR